MLRELMRNAVRPFCLANAYFSAGGLNAVVIGRSLPGVNFERRKIQAVLLPLKHSDVKDRMVVVQHSVVGPRGVDRCNSAAKRGNQAQVIQKNPQVVDESCVRASDSTADGDGVVASAWEDPGKRDDRIPIGPGDV